MVADKDYPMTNRLFLFVKHCVLLACAMAVFLCLASDAMASKQRPGKVPEGLQGNADDGGAIDQKEFSGVTIQSIFRGSSTEPKVVMFYPKTGNDEIDANILTFIKAHLNAFDEMKTGSIISGGADNSLESFAKWIISSNYTVTYPSKNIISITFQVRVKDNRRPGEINATLNYDRHSGQHIMLNDLFDNPKLGLQLLSEWSRQALPKMLPVANNGDITEGTRPEEKNFSNFSIVPSGIVIHFMRNQVGPGVVGSPDLLVPLKALAEAGPRASVWDTYVDLRKVALSIPLQTPLPADYTVSEEYATFHVPNGDLVLPGKIYGEYVEKCIYLIGPFMLHTDGKSEKYAFIEGHATYGGTGFLGYVWGIYPSSNGFKSTPPVVIGDRYSYTGVKIKDNMIIFTGVSTHYISEVKDVKLRIVNGSLQKTD